MSYAALRRLVPGWLRRQVFYFETRIVEAITAYAAELPSGARLLDAGAGEGQYQSCFPAQRYVGVDLGIGDPAWNYAGLDCLADLHRLPFRDGVFSAALSVVTLEHVLDPGRALAELARVAAPGARLLLVVPHEWEVHQHPHDYWRFTRYGITHLLAANGWEPLRVEPGGGFFRLLSRRLMNGLQFLPGWLMPLAALAVVPAALLIAALDSLDRQQDYTLGYICWARRKSI